MLFLCIEFGVTRALSYSGATKSICVDVTLHTPHGGIARDPCDGRCNPSYGGDAASMDGREAVHVRCVDDDDPQVAEAGTLCCSLLLDCHGGTPMLKILSQKVRADHKGGGGHLKGDTFPACVHPKP